jgi:hypothetical protein
LHRARRLVKRTFCDQFCDQVLALALVAHRLGLDCRRLVMSPAQIRRRRAQSALAPLGFASR